MLDPNRPLSQGKIAALKLLKLAYDDAEDAGEEPRQFASRKEELTADGATSTDLLWLLKMRYVEHVREVTSDGEPRRQFRDAAAVLGPDSCFFLTYADNISVERDGLHRYRTSKPKSRRAGKRKPSGDEEANHRQRAVTRRGKRRAASAGTSQPRSPPGERELPAWDASEGNLYWCRKVILHLATWADVERAILDEFEAWRWESPIPNPIPRDAAGDPTQARRHAVYNLNRHLGENPPFEFFCLKGDLMGWGARLSRRRQT